MRSAAAAPRLNHAGLERGQPAFVVARPQAGGRVHAVEIRPVERNTVLACEIVDSTGQLTALFYGRSYIPGLNPGAKVRLTGPLGAHGREVVMTNPAYELLAPGSDESPPS